MRLKQQWRLAAACVVGLAAAPSWGIVSSNTNLDIAQVIGAYTFYDNGFIGDEANIANVEAGFIWSGQQTLTQDTVEFSNPGAADQFDKHATWVGSTLNGQGSSVMDRGIAYGATVWSGAIATSWAAGSADAYSDSFNVTQASFSEPYFEAMVGGVPEADNQTADVINSSWTSSGDPDGRDNYAIILDALIGESGKTLVLAAGNSGPTTNTVNAPASGNNAIVVGALQSDESSPAYGSIAGFSSVSPSSFFVPSETGKGTELTGVRALVDITAPAQDLTLADYGGAEGGNAFGGPTSTSTNSFDTQLAGTSFSSPIVAASAALIVDSGKALFPTDPNAIDGRVVKAVLMNSASKPAGWNNGQTTTNGVITTKQALDYSYGTGILNLNQAFTQYTGGTTDLPSPNGGNVKPTGWVFGQITHNPSQTVTVDYPIATPMLAGSNLTATLDWFSDDLVTPDPTVPNQLDPAYGSFDNLDLCIYLTSTGSSPELIAQSISLYNSVQHLSFALPTTGSYEIAVSETNYVYNFVGDTTTDFGLAWANNALTSTWNGAGTDNHGTTAANWGGAAPSPGNALIFAGNTQLNPNNDFAAGTDFAGISFAAGAGSFVLSGSSVNLSGDIVNNSTSPQSVNVNLNLQQGVSLNAATANLSVGGSISGAFPLNIIGTAVVTLSGINTYTGNTTVKSGQLIVSNNGALPSTTALSIGTPETSATVQLTPNIGQCTISGLALTSGSTLDLTNNSLAINYSDTPGQTLARIEAALASGYNGGAWNGAGIISSSAAGSNGQFALGYADGTLDSGTPAAADQVLIQYTLIGDANLDGSVNLTDLLSLLNNYGESGRDWSEGDFNYDDTVNLTDLLALLNNYGQSDGNSALRAQALRSTAVPEPASIGLLGLSASGLLARRRRIS